MIHNKIAGNLLKLTLGLLLGISLSCKEQPKKTDERKPQTVVQQLPDVSIVQSKEENCTKITEDQILSMVEQSLNSIGGWNGLVKDGDSVVIKPNLVTTYSYLGPNWGRIQIKEKECNGNTTDWRVVKAVVTLLRRVNPSGKIYVIEGSADENTSIDVYTYLNYTKEKIPGVDEFLYVEDDNDTVTVKLPDAKLDKKEYIYNRKIKEANCLISLPTLKNHWNAVITGGIKNLAVGSTPGNKYNPKNPKGRQAYINHADIRFHYWLRDYYKGRPADLVIVDGLQGLQNGPTPSNPLCGHTQISQDWKNMRLIIAGRNAVKTDAVCGYIMRWDPHAAQYLRLLSEDGLGSIDLADIRVVGKRIDEVSKTFEGNVTMLVVPVPGINPKIFDKTPPLFNTLAPQVNGQTMLLPVIRTGDAVRVDCLVDGAYHATVRYPQTSFTLDITSLAAGEHNLTMIAYDPYANTGIQSFKFTK